MIRLKEKNVLFFFAGQSSVFVFQASGEFMSIYLVLFDKAFVDHLAIHIILIIKSYINNNENKNNYVSISISID